MQGGTPRQGVWGAGNPPEQQGQGGGSPPETILWTQDQDFWDQDEVFLLFKKYEICLGGHACMQDPIKDFFP